MNQPVRIKLIGVILMTGFMLLPTRLMAQEKITLGRVVFLGDSITQAGNEPNGYVSLIREALQNNPKGDKAEVIGAGVSGNKVPDLLARLDQDVLALKPTTVVIYIGINDVWHSQNGNGTPQDQYSAGLREVVDRIQAVGAQTIVCTPSVIGERKQGSNDLDQQLDTYAALSRTVAKESNSLLIDLRAAFIKHLTTANPTDAAEGILTTDGVHLNGAGNKFVAQVILDELNRGHHAAELRHVVLVKFAPDLSAELVEETVRDLCSLQEQINTVKRLEWGTDVSKENRAQGYTHCFLLTFADEAGRDFYLNHEAHQAFVKIALPRVENVLVVDYWSHE